MRAPGIPLRVQADGDRVTRREGIRAPAAAYHDRCRPGFYLPHHSFAGFVHRLNVNEHMGIAPQIPVDRSLERDYRVAVITGITVVCPRNGRS